MLSTTMFLLLASTAALHPVTLSLESTPPYAVRHIPQLKAASLRIEEARGHMLGAGRLQSPELEFEFSQNVPISATLEEQLKNAYATGQAPLAEVLRARARRLELAQRRIEALRDYHLAKARWDASLGRNIPSGGGPGK